MKKRGGTSGEGNSGEWYLALVGAPTSGPPTTLRDLPSAPPPDPAPAAPAGPAPEAEAIPGPGGPDETHTAELVGQLWDAQGRPDPLADWAPEELSRTIRSRRNFRWTAVAITVVIGVIAWTLAAWLPSLSERRADARAAEYIAVISELRRLLPDAQLALADVTDAADPTDRMGSIVERVTNLEIAADNVGLSAVEPLPSTPPLVPSGPIDELEPIRDRLAMIGADASAVAGRITTALGNRTLSPTILQLPELPMQADTENANELSVTLAGILADSVGTRSQLGDDPAFAGYNAEVDAAIARFGQWQAEYVDALRRRDQETVTTLLDEMTALRGALDDALFTSLADLRSEVDQAIIALAADIESLQLLIPG